MAQALQIDATDAEKVTDPQPPISTQASASLAAPGGFDEQDGLLEVVSHGDYSDPSEGCIFNDFSNETYGYVYSGIFSHRKLPMI
jgi:hypothetical protein